MDDSVLVSMIQSRWCLACARCTLSSPLLIQICMDVPPICEEHSNNATTLTCRYLQVHGTSHPSLFGASGSICMAPGRKTDIQNWTGWNYSELYYLQILIGYDVRSSFLIVFFSTLSQHSAMGMVESQKIRYPSHHPTVLQRISGLIPSLCSLSVTKFPYGNVDCALEKTPSAPSVCNGKNLMLSLQGTWHVSCCTQKNVMNFQLHLKLRLAAFDQDDQGHGPSCCKVPCTTFPTRHVKLMVLFLRCEILAHTLAIWLTMLPLDWAYRLWLWTT